MTDALTRRTFLAGSATAALALSTAVSAGAEERGLRAAVLEHTDQWTSARGLADLLRGAGFSVIDLDPDRPATEQAQDVDLIALGTFTNNADPYQRFITQQADSIAEFVASGRVLLDLAQSDQFNPSAGYLPEPLQANRADPDHSTVFPIDLDHPLVKDLPQSGGRIFTGRQGFPVSYETLSGFRGMRVLMAVSAQGQPPCLLEGQHGTGRFLISSLTVDKVYDAAGTAIQPGAALADSETFFATIAGYVDLVRRGVAPDVVPTVERAAGPMVGHTTSTGALIWLRPGTDHHAITDWTVTVSAETGTPVVTTTTISPDNDHTMVFDVAGLRAGTSYSYRIRPSDTSVAFEELTGGFTTSAADRRCGTVRIGVGSCAPDGEDGIWDRIVAEDVDSFVMLGDTPYIDSTDLDVARQKHRDWLKGSKLAALVSSRPIWGTWDDHDFGGNDVHGDLAGKRNNRTAFVDYRAHASYGEDASGALMTGRGSDGEGVYTSFRRGPVEMFLLDPRWFSRVGPSFADPDLPSCLGDAQWAWLQRGLRRSTATFKIVASGMIWDDKLNSETDDWGFYSHERELILDFIRDQRISGVVLMGGDIHVSRALNYGPRIGYDLWQFIVSPMHASTIASLNVPHPALVHSAVEPNVFLTLDADTTVDPPTLDATWINRAGETVFAVSTTLADLTPAPVLLELTGDATDELVPGTPVELTTTVTNNDIRPVQGVEVELTVPQGWTAEALSTTSFPRLAVRAEAVTRWRVVPATDAAAGATTLSAGAGYRSGGTAGETAAEVVLTVIEAGRIPRTSLSVAAVSSEQTGEGADRAIDGQASTFWHTRWSTSPVPGYPHWIVLDLGERHDVDGLGYLPRQDAPNSRMADYQIYVSDDPESWGEAVATGTFTTGTARTRVDFAASPGRYLRLVGLSSQNGGVWGGAGEIELYGRPV